jgi:chemotaxis protein CheD
MKVYTSDPPSPERIKVGVAEYAVATGKATLATSGLGSCVGVAIADTDAGVAGLAHAMLPSGEGRVTGEAATDGGDVDADSPGKYVDTAISDLVDAMVEHGADRSRIKARLAGGSAMFEFSSADGGVGKRNIVAAEAALAERDIPIVAADTGGDYGRSLTLDVETGSLSVRRAHGDTEVI